MFDLTYLRVRSYAMSVRLVTGRDIGSRFPFLAPIQGGRGVLLPVSSGLTSRAPLYRGFYFIFKEFVMVVGQTTIVESAVLPVFGKLGIPGMKLIGWCEDKEQDKIPHYAVFLEAESGKGDCLFLEVELQEGFLPGSGNWFLIKREDVASVFRGDDPEYEGHNFLVSRTPYWKEVAGAIMPGVK
jgi:hypothetical protein